MLTIILLTLFMIVSSQYLNKKCEIVKNECEDSSITGICNHFGCNSQNIMIKTDHCNNNTGSICSFRIRTCVVKKNIGSCMMLPSNLVICINKKTFSWRNNCIE